MRDLRIYIHYLPKSAYAPTPDNSTAAAAREDFLEASKVAFTMWQSLFLAMHVTFVNSPYDANLELRVGNFKGTDPDLPYPPEATATRCGPDGTQWVACSFSPEDWRPDGKNVILFDTYGSLKFRFKDFTFLSRDRVWKGYEPATLPPRAYVYDAAHPENNNPGFTGGWFDIFRDNPGIGSDATFTVFHEFGHTLGFGHQDITDQLLAFNGIPHPPGVAPGPTPNLIKTTPSATPGLPPEFYDDANGHDGYYGGGTPSAPWVGDLRFDALPFCQMMIVGLKPIHPGLMYPVPELFNFRIINQTGYDLFKSHVNDYSRLMQFPNSRGIIRLQKSPNDPGVLTTNWLRAGNLTQLDVATQNNPYFVSGVFNNGQIQKIAAGSTHTLAIRNNGTLWTWGKNDLGQLGDGTHTSHSSPKQLGTATNWVSVAAGSGFSVALAADNTVWLWGARDMGQVGDGVVSSTTQQLTPKMLPGNSWVAVKAGAKHVLALKADGTLYAWGGNTYNQLGFNTNQAFGTTYASTPVTVYSQGQHWVGIGAGPYNSMAMEADGGLWTWGYNTWGNVGDGTTAQQDRPTREYLGKTNWQFTQGGISHSAALDADGHFYTWGGNNSGQLGVDPSSLPYTTIPEWNVDDTWSAVAAGSEHTGGITKSGRLYSWGSNTFGQLGSTQNLGSYSPYIVQESTYGEDWVSAVFGPTHSLAMREDGTLWGWGNNAAGQLGTGSTNAMQTTPVKSKWYYYGPKNVTIAPQDSRYLAPASIALSATAEGPVSKVEFWNGTSRITTVTTPPYTYQWTGKGYGIYKVRAIAYDALGASQSSKEVTLEVSTLTVAVAPVTATRKTNLTTEGLVDWAQYGRGSGQMENRKAFVPPAIEALSQISIYKGITPVASSGYLMGFSWTDGSAIGTKTETGTYTGLKITAKPEWGGLDGFLLHVEGLSSTKRTVKLYMDATDINMGFCADLQGFPSCLPLSATNGARIYTITVQSPTPKVLTLNPAGIGTASGSLTLQAVTVK